MKKLLMGLLLAGFLIPATIVCMEDGGESLELERKAVEEKQEQVNQKLHEEQRQEEELRDQLDKEKDTDKRKELDKELKALDQQRRTDEAKAEEQKVADSDNKASLDAKKEELEKIKQASEERYEKLKKLNELRKDLSDSQDKDPDKPVKTLQTPEEKSKNRLQACKDRLKIIDTHGPKISVKDANILQVLSELGFVPVEGDLRSRDDIDTVAHDNADRIIMSLKEWKPEGYRPGEQMTPNQYMLSTDRAHLTTGDGKDRVKQAIKSVLDVIDNKKSDPRAVEAARRIIQMEPLTEAVRAKDRMDEFDRVLKTVNANGSKISGPDAHIFRILAEFGIAPVEGGFARREDISKVAKENVARILKRLNEWKRDPSQSQNSQDAMEASISVFKNDKGADINKAIENVLYMIDNEKRNSRVAKAAHEIVTMNAPEVELSASQEIGFKEAARKAPSDKIKEQLNKLRTSVKNLFDAMNKTAGKVDAKFTKPVSKAINSFFSAVTDFVKKSAREDLERHKKNIKNISEFVTYLFKGDNSENVAENEKRIYNDYSEIMKAKYRKLQSDMKNAANKPKATKTDGQGF